MTTYQLETDDGKVLGYIQRTSNLHYSHWIASPDKVVWHSPFATRREAREWLET